ncbi:Rpn family recombination-promoting nuclease/putative transposase [Dolichospermum sp. UHCC 0259]|uniref:Rpn family recombination-promoting nuclease/putative transposase n=1 Tax=Dolichospermum sp. UHCC 0259 TaxID=2590010 RepID=UPI0020C4A06B|nr:Rpn family recombination-promoting nuclease/putative transposase [Dolichospermum sp. UHCC 0259]
MHSSRIFLTFHTLLFEILGEPAQNATGYKFTSVEVKEKAFRFDGIFMADSAEKPIYFVEVQFQPKPDFYWELIAEINIYLNQFKPVQDWQDFGFAQSSSSSFICETEFRCGRINCLSTIMD